MNCLIYARVSTGAQAIRQLSIPAQLGAMRQHATREGWTILEEFLEAGMSGRTSSRPELTRMLGRCKGQEPRVDVVLVHKLDRLARNLADHLAIRSFLAQHQVRLVSVTENIDDSVSGQLVEHMIASLAEFYSANLGEEVRKGLTERVRQGGWPHLQPFGYRRLGLPGAGARPIEPDPTLRPLILYVFQAAATGQYRAVDLIAWLKQQGVPFSAEGMRRLLRNPFYCGRLHWKGQVLSGRHPAIVPPALFDRVQEVLREHRRSYVRAPHLLLLHGFARCASCGTLVGSERHEQYSYYRCRGTFRTPRTCRARAASVVRIEGMLLARYRRLPLTADMIERFGEIEAKHRKAQRRDAEWQRVWNEDQRQHGRIRELRLAEALASGNLDPELYGLAIQKLRRETPPVSESPSTETDRAILSLKDADTVAALHCQLDERRQRYLLEAAVEELSIDDAGIVGFKPRSTPSRVADAA